LSKPETPGDANDNSRSPETAPRIFDQDQLRYLATIPGLGPGSRVLLCGISDTDLIQGLSHLGMLVTCLHEDDSQAEQLQQSAPEAECCEGGAPREQFDNQSHGFDLAVVSVPTKLAQPSIFARSQLIELAGRLACLRPGGTLVMFGQTGQDCGLNATHSLSCCLNQLSLFPGRRTIQRAGGQSRLRFASRRGQFALALQIPKQRMSPFEWDVLAMEGDSRLSSECCRKVGQIDDRRAA
jgi:hypothetical protein